MFACFLFAKNINSHAGRVRGEHFQLITIFHGSWKGEKNLTASSKITADLTDSRFQHLPSRPYLRSVLSRYWCTVSLFTTEFMQESWISGEFSLRCLVGRYAVEFLLEYRWAAVNGVVMKIEPKFSKWLNSDASHACKNLSSPLRSFSSVISLLSARIIRGLNIKSEYLIEDRVYISLFSF